MIGFPSLAVRRRRSLPLLVGACLVLAAPAAATELVVRLSGVPPTGRLVVQLYDDPDAFGDFRDPVLERTLAARGDGPYELEDLAPGELALLVFLDENGNGVLDRNFIGIPREPLGLSRNYRPKGPPSFERASFRLPDAERHDLEIELYRVLGERGLIGAGLGVIGRGSPYVESDRSVARVIPTITYVGERLQWLGPDVSYGVAGSDRTRLAVTASYRVGSYEEEDSPRLRGLGDREDTLMLGLGLQFELPRGFELEVGYQHDALDRIGGGTAEIGLSRGFQAGVARLSPQLSVVWQSAALADHDFGVAAAAAEPDRPAYRPGSGLQLGLGLVSLIEISEAWRLVLNVRGERLDSAARASPIVDDDTVVSGFAAITYAF